MINFNSILKRVQEATAAIDTIPNPNNGGSWQELAVTAISDLSQLEVGSYLFINWNGPALYKCASIDLDNDMYTLTHVVTANQIRWPLSLISKYFIAFSTESYAPPKTDESDPIAGSAGSNVHIENITSAIYKIYKDLLQSGMELKQVIKSVAQQFKVDNWTVMKAIDLSESIYKIQKPDPSSFIDTNSDGTLATCGKCGHCNIDPKTHVCTTLIEKHK